MHLQDMKRELKKRYDKLRRYTADEYARTVLARLSKKYNVSKPKIEVSGRLSRFIPEQIYIGEFIRKYWVADPERTKTLIQFEVAHEFKHYLQYFEVGAYAWHTATPAQRISWTQEADRFAESYIGMTKEEMIQLIKEIPLS